MEDIKKMEPERRIFYLGMLEEEARIEAENADKLKSSIKGRY